MNAGRGSRPGFSSSREDVGDRRQAERVVDEVVRRAARAAAALLPISASMSRAGRREDPPHHRVRLGVHAGGVERVVAAADAQEARALLERLRARAAAPPSAPAGCGTGRWRRGAARCSRPARRRCPDTRVSSGAEAVLTSTPTAFTQSSTTASSERDSFDLGHVVLVLADADRLGVDLHQLGQRVLQPARDRHRAAQRHVQVGQLLRGVGRGRVDRGAGLGDHDLGQLAAPACRLIRSPASLSVSREAVPLPIAISSTPCAARQPGQGGERLVPAAAAATCG